MEQTKIFSMIMSSLDGDDVDDDGDDDDVIVDDKS